MLDGARRYGAQWLLHNGLFPYGDAQRFSIGAKFCTYARLGATYYMPSLYHYRLKDLCTMGNFVLARAKCVGAGTVSYAQLCRLLKAWC